MINSEGFFFQDNAPATVVCNGLVASTDPFSDGSLLSKLQFDGDIIDTTSNYTYSTEVGTYVTGAHGQAIESDGASGTLAYVDDATFANKIATTKEFSISCNIKLKSSYGTALKFIFCIRSDISFFYVLLQNNQIEFRHVNAAGSYNMVLTCPVTMDDQFRHFVFTNTPTENSRIWMDGVEAASQASINTTDNYEITPYRVSVGYTVQPSATIDQVEFYNRDLTADEIYDLYTQSAYCSDPTPQDYVAFYPLTGTAEDVGGVYDGTENGGLTYVNDVTRGSVVDFTAVTDIDCGYKPISNTKSYTFWSKLTGTSYEYIMGGSTFGTSGTVSDVNGVGITVVQEASNVMRVTTSNGNSQYSNVYTVATAQRDNWNFISVYEDWTNNKIAISINAATAEILSPTVWLTKPYSFNRHLGSYANAPTGTSKMSSFREYNRELTPEEITTIYDYELVTHHIPVDDGLVAYYPLNSNSMDNYFNQYDGTESGVTYDGVSALHDGNTSYIENASIANAKTIVLWVKTTDTNDNSYVVDARLTTGAAYALISATGGTMNFAGATVKINGVSATNEVTVPAVNTWIQIAIELTSTTTGLTFGARYTHSVTNSLNGYMSNVRVYDRVVSDAELTAIYDAELSEHL